MTQVYGRYRTRTYGLFRVKVRTLENSQVVATARLRPHYQNHLKGDRIAFFDHRTRVRSPKDDQTHAELRPTMPGRPPVVAVAERTEAR